MPRAGGGSVAVKVKMDDLGTVSEYVKSLEKKSEKALDYTIKTYKTRMPGWIAAEVVKEYNIGKTQITSQKIGRIRKIGNGLGLTLEYTGRRLTPIHFGMKPKKPPKPTKLSKKDWRNVKMPNGQYATVKKGVKPYNITAEIKRGERKTLTGKYPTPWFLAPAAKGSSTVIPFQRSPGHRKGFKTVARHTVSLPQMISHDGHTLKPEIAKEIEPKMEKVLHDKIESFINK